MQKEKKGKKPKKILITALAFFLLFWLYTWIPVTERVKVDLTGEQRGSVSIALVSDLHSCYYGKGQSWLIKRIEREKPDIIVLAGDIFDDKLPDENALITLKALSQMCPCFYVTGNHEYWSGRAEDMKKSVWDTGVYVLDGSCKRIRTDIGYLAICGVDDPDEMTMSGWKEQLDRARSQAEEGDIRILVSHRPEKVDVYEDYDFDLILSGHAHGGQFRIPFWNRGVFAPDQGVMAKYVNGVYELSNGSRLAVSRGLARESTPGPRFFNHPELLMVEIN